MNQIDRRWLDAVAAFRAGDLDAVVKIIIEQQIAKRLGAQAWL